MKGTMAKTRCEEIIIDQYLKGNIGNEYKTAALLELHNNDTYYNLLSLDTEGTYLPTLRGERKTLVDILEWALGFGPDCVVSQLRQLEKIYYTDQIEALKKELKELEHELSK